MSEQDKRFGGPETGTPRGLPEHRIHTELSRARGTVAVDAAGARLEGESPTYTLGARTAAHVSYRFEHAAFPGHAWRVSHVHLEEVLAGPYRAVVRLSTTETHLDATELLGRNCVLSIERAPLHHRVCGIVREVDEGSLRGREERAHVTVEIVPALALLALRKDSRVFQHESAPEILQKVLQEGLWPYERTVRFELQDDYPKREYCLQYEETDLDFVQRLVEEEGISYGFEHDGEVEVLVLRDKNVTYGDVETLDGHAVPYTADDRLIGRVEPIDGFHPVHRTTARSYALRDFDWTRPREMRIDHRHHRSAEDGRGGEHGFYEHTRSLTITDYDQGIEKYRMQDGSRQARVRGELHARDARAASGLGRVVGFAPGLRFELSGHPNLGADGEYLLTRVAHVSEPLPGLQGASERDPYHNRFECIPFDVQFRPNRHVEKPRIHSIQTAVVVGPAGEEIYTDEHGRIKVEFHWDRRGAHDERSSCWMRVQQPWAGNGWGFSFIPRIGMEVLVSFLDGDPDRPLAIGSVYNGTNRSPYALPENKTRSTIKTSSSPGGAGYNELRFEDKSGHEEIWLHGQKDWNTHVENDVTERVDRDRHRLVTRHESVSVGVNSTQRVGNTRQRSVGADEVVSIGRTQEIRVGRHSVVQVAGGLVHSVGASAELSFGKDHRVTVGRHSVMQVEEQHVVEAKRVVVQAEDEILLKCGENFISIDSNRIVMEGYQVLINCEQCSSDASPPETEAALSDGDEELEEEAQ